MSGKNANTAKCDNSGLARYNLCMASVTQQHIVSDDGYCGGWPRVAGTRIRVWDIYVWSQRDHLSPAQIVAEFPQLSVASMHAALAYYFDNVDAIRLQVKESEERVSAAKATGGRGLLDRLKDGDASDSASS